MVMFMKAVMMMTIIESAYECLWPVSDAYSNGNSGGSDHKEWRWARGDRKKKKRM